MSARPVSGFAAHVAELLEPLGGVVIRRMFGGYGVFKDGCMFGLIADDVLYFRTDDGNRPAYEASGLEPFVYEMRGRATAMPYNRAPDEGFDDPDLLCAWAAEAHAAALRQKRAKRRGG
jgi:DNA transformation protein